MKLLAQILFIFVFYGFFDCIESLKSPIDLFNKRIAKYQDRIVYQTILSFSCLTILSSNLILQPCYAIDNNLQNKPLPIYKSGKNPSSSSSSDSKVGTKKDIDFLRCMSNCKSDCQKPGEGLAKNDCIQDCQDQCCNSYEQCSFKIKINTGNSI